MRRRFTVTTVLIAGWLASAAVAPLAAEDVFVEEQEPNPAALTATPLGGSAVRARGNIFPGADVDYWSFQATAGDRVYAAVMTAASPQMDSWLDVLAADGVTILESDDDNGSLGPTSSSIAGVAIPATGTYFVRVTGRTAPVQIRPYHLYFQLRTGAPSPEVEPNDRFAGAQLPVSGWVTGSTSSTTDQDYYSLALNAGDVVFLSLDLDPERDDLDWNGGLFLGPFKTSFLGVDDLNYAGPDSEAFFLKVATTGTYIVLVDGNNSFGTYHLSVSVHPAIAEGVNCTTHASAVGPVPIPSLGTFTSTIHIPGHPRIADLDVSIRLDHPNLPDLDVHLVSPAGNDNGLFTDIGLSALPVMDFTLDDEAAFPAAFFLDGPTQQPEASYRLAWFDGEDAGGTWSLVVRDDAAGNDGTFTGWSLRVCEPNPPEPCPPGYTPATVYTSDFESGDAGFTHSGTADEWQWGTPSFPPVKTTCASGAYCWATDLDDTYDANSSQDLLSPVIPLYSTLAAPIEVSWAQRYQMDAAEFDHYSVDVEEASGANPRRLFEWLDAAMTDSVGNPASPVAASAGWGVVRRRIDAYAGQDVRLRFHLDSSATNQYAGVAIDDVKVVACQLSPDLIFRDGFE